MKIVDQGVIALLKSAITGEPCPLPREFDLAQAYPRLRAHKVLALGYQGALNCGLDRQTPVMRLLFRDYCASTLLSERQLTAAQTLFDAFEAAGVDYMPVKGCNMKKLYPAHGLRTMGDADILIRTEQYDRARTVMLKLGYEEGVESDHEWVWDSAPLHVELHKRLVPTRHKDFYGYYGDGWRLAARSEGHHYYMTEEDQYLFVFTHFARHYQSGGIGCSHLLDLWVCQRSCPDMDQAYLRRELDKLGLTEFYDNICKVLDVWFRGAEPDEKTEFMTAYMMNNGVWGSEKNHLLSQSVQKAYATNSAEKNRIKWMMTVLFPSRAGMEELYPQLRQKPALLPVMWVRRWVDVLRFRRKNVKKQLNNFQTMSGENIREHEEELKYVGLDFADHE